MEYLKRQAQLESASRCSEIEVCTLFMHVLSFDRFMDGLGCISNGCLDNKQSRLDERFIDAFLSCVHPQTSSLLSSSSTALPDVAIPPLISATSSSSSKPSGSYSSSPSSSAAAAGQPITEVSGVAARVEAGLKADGGNLQASTVAASGVFKNSRSFMC